MLKIILGLQNAKQYLPKNAKFVVDTNGFFNGVFLTGNGIKYLNDPFVKKVIKEIDKAEMITTDTLRDMASGDIFGINNISGGAKTLISIYYFKNRTFLARMGDNCCDLLEEIALLYEKNGNDLVIVDDWTHDFQFRHIKEIYYYNYDQVARNRLDILGDIAPRYVMETRYIDDEAEDDE